MYEIHFKHASLKQIFSGASRKYRNDCRSQVTELVKAEVPETAVMGIIHRPHLLIWPKINTPGPSEALKAKLLALPFVEKIETEEALMSRKKGDKSIRDRVTGFVQRFIY